VIIIVIIRIGVKEKGRKGEGERDIRVGPNQWIEGPFNLPRPNPQKEG